MYLNISVNNAAIYVMVNLSARAQSLKILTLISHVKRVSFPENKDIKDNNNIFLKKNRGQKAHES
jgi:hypothetical protein